MNKSNVFFYNYVYMRNGIKNWRFYNGRVSSWITSNENLLDFKSSIIAEDTSAGKIEPTAAFVV